MDRDNQQETITSPLTDMEIGWLAGTIESDGFVTIACVPATKKKKTSGNVLVPKVGVTNTDSLIIERVSSLFARLGVNGYIRTSGMPVDKGKLMYSCESGKLGGVKAILTTILPAMAGSKAGSARLILEFVERRLARKYLPYDEDEIATISMWDRNTPTSKGKTRTNLDRFLRDFTPDTGRPRDDEGKFASVA